MFGTLYNQARLLYRLEPLTGLLIKSGRESFNPARPNMEFVRTRVEVLHDGRPEVWEVPFLPGSSLKGVLRSHAERILRTMDRRSCDPTANDRGCSGLRRGSFVLPYRDHCYACRTFGSTSLAGRVRPADAYPWKPGATPQERAAGAAAVLLEPRSGVKIDRRTGTAAGGALYELEVATSGAFYGEVTLRNYQLWQLALVALVLRDLDEGYQRVGAMKSRGLGWVRVGIEEFQLQQYGPLAATEQGAGVPVRGIGAAGAGLGDHGLVSGDEVAAPAPLRAEGDGFSRVTFGPSGAAQEGWDALAAALIGGQEPGGTPWRSFLEQAASRQPEGRRP